MRDTINIEGNSLDEEKKLFNTYKVEVEERCSKTASVLSLKQNEIDVLRQQLDVERSCFENDKMTLIKLRNDIETERMRQEDATGKLINASKV